MGLQGSFEAFSLPEVMQLIAAGDRNGRLYIACENDARVVTFGNGKVLGVTGLGRRFRLLHALLRQGVLDPIALAELGLGAQASDEELTQVLLERGIVSEERLEDALRQQVQEALDDVFQWRDGGFLFRDSTNEPTTERRGFAVQPLLMEALRKQDEWRELTELFSSPDAVPKFVEDHECIASLPPGADDAFAVLELVDGRSSVRMICRRSGFSDYRALRALALLHDSGLIRVGSGATSRLALGTSLGAGRSVPVMPRAGARALAVALHEDPEPRLLRALALSDPGLAVTVLETAASAGAERSKAAGWRTIGEVLERLGLETSADAMIVAGLRGHYAAAGAAWPALWRHSLAVAEAATQLARLLKLEEGKVEALRLAGVLHDVGCYLLRRANPARYRQVLEEAQQQKLPLHQVETRRLLTNHARVGANYLESLGLGVELTRAIERHHEATKEDELEARVLCVAETLAQAHLPHPEGGGELRPFAERLLELFGLPPAAARALERAFVRGCAVREPLW